MQQDNRKEAARWLLQAEHDLSDARFASGGKRFNLACFLAQQAAEKALKSFLFLQHEEDVWGHSAADLCRQAQAIEPRFAEISAPAAALDKYYIPTRYPNALPGGIPSEAYQESDAMLALGYAEKVIAFVKAR
jgi:HEPN domain-containing protein